MKLWVSVVVIMGGMLMFIYISMGLIRPEPGRRALSHAQGLIFSDYFAFNFICERLIPLFSRKHLAIL